MSKFAQHEYLSLTITLMFIGGTFKINSENKIKRTLYRLWRVTLNLMMSYTVVAASIDLIQKGFKDSVLGVLNYSYIAACTCITLKLSYFYIFDKNSEDIVKEMYRLFKRETRTGCGEKDIRNSVSFIRAMALLWVLGTTLCAQSVMILPLFLNKGSNRVLPIPMWFPYDWRISPFYELTVMYQVFLQQLITTTMVGTDMFFASLIILTAKQFRLLGWEIKHLLYTVLIKNGVDRETVLAMQEGNVEKSLRPSPELLEKIKVDLLERFNQLIRFHQSLLRFCDRLEEFFAPTYLSYFLIILVLDTFLGFLVATVENLVLSIIFGAYLFVTTTTIFIPCYFGELLTTQAEALLYDVYESPWYICDEKFKVHFKCLQQKSCKPIYLTVGKFTNLSLSAFLWIEQTVVSYVLVLYQLTHVDDK